MEISIIIPTLNERDNLPLVIPRIPQAKKIKEIMIVDGHSKDDTVNVARKLNPLIRVIYQTGNGKGDAILCGVKNISCDYFLILDADGSQLSDDIPVFIEKAKQGFDLVKGSRYIDSGKTDDATTLHNLIVRTANTVANVLWRTKFTDICYGMFLMNKYSYLSLNIVSNSFDIEWELMIKAKRRKLKIAEVPVHEHKRVHGKSHITYIRDGWIIGKRVLMEALRKA
jgi:glycosyltransferase involved in cell wall biosynthesis